MKEKAIIIGKKVSQAHKSRQKQMVGKISLQCTKVNITVEEQKELHILQNQLDDLYIDKAKGAFIRFKAKWIEQGEKNSSYSSGLEKRRQTKKCITKLTKNGNIIQDTI